ncbi:MAG: cyclase family protein [Candidatus Omnitrophica bacterium]|nr:cyclase family protein [Candidatus Omnitrophota bacterium]
MKRSGKTKIIDISLSIREGMVGWPSDPKVLIRSFKSLRRGDSSNVSQLTLGTHAGTHIDAPYHCMEKGKSLDRMPLEALIGECRVIEIKDNESIKAPELKKFRIKKNERIIFKTINSKRERRLKAFDRDFIYMTEEAAIFLAKKKIKAVGIDYLSVGGYKKDGKNVHEALLKRGILIIEGLSLAKVRPGTYELVCLPLKILKADGAPARAVLIDKR